MDLAQLYKKQEQDKELFNALRDKIWSELKQKHDQTILAFRTKENLPESYSKQIDKELKDFTKDWAIPHGVRYKAMAVQQQKEFEAIAGKPSLENEPERKISNYERSLSSTKAKSKQREKSPEKFFDLDQNKESMDLDMQ